MRVIRSSMDLHLDQEAREDGAEVVSLRAVIAEAKLDGLESLCSVTTDI